VHDAQYPVCVIEKDNLEKFAVFDGVGAEYMTAGKQPVNVLRIAYHRSFARFDGWAVT
jgi:hypothetical protein